MEKLNSRRIAYSKRMCFVVNETMLYLSLIHIFIFGSQPIDSQAEMVRKVKKFKAGFVISDSNLTPENTLADVIALVQRTEHSTIGVTDDGTPNGKLLGMVTSRDYRAEKDSPDKKVKEFMTPFSKLIVGELGMTLSEANQIRCV